MIHSFILRKLTIAGLLLCLITLSLASACAGPAGPTGSAGPAGARGPAGAAAPSPQAVVIVTPVAVEQGKTFNVAGSGFEPEGLVVLTLAGAPLDLGYLGVKTTAGDEFHFVYAETNQSGAFATAVKHKNIVKALATLEPGVYTVRAEDGKGTVATYPLALTEKKAE